MAIIEGTGIVAAGKEARAKALAKSKQVTSDKKIAAEYKVDPIDRMLRDINKNFDRIRSQESTGGTKERGRGMGDTFDPTKDFSVSKPSFFSPGGGAFDERNNVKVATTDLSSLKSDDTSESTFGKSFTKQADANLADASVYKQKEDSVYRDTTDSYEDFKNVYKKPSTDETVKSIEKFYGLDPRGITYTPRDESKYEGSVIKSNVGLPDKTLTTKERISGTKPIGYREDDGLTINPIKFDKGTAFGIGLNLDYKNKYGLTKDRLFGGSMYSDDPITQSYVKAIGQSASDALGIEDKLRKEKEAQEQAAKEKAKIDAANARFEKISEDFLNDAAFKKRLKENTETDSSAKEENTGDKVDNFLNLLGNIQYVGPEATPTEKPVVEEKKPNILQRAGNFIGDITGKVLGIQPAGAAENPLSRTVPSGAFNISQEGKDQAAINRGIKAAEATGIPTGVAAQGGVTTQKAIDAGIKARQEAANTRAKNMSEAQRIAARNPNVSIVGGKAVATNNSGVARAQAMAVNRKIQGKTVSQVQAENKKSMQDAARKRNEAFKKSQAQKKKKTSGKGFGSTTQGKSVPSRPPAGSFGISAAGRVQAAKNRAAAKKKASTQKKSTTSKTSTKKSSKVGSKKASRGAKGSAGSRSKGGTSKGGGKAKGSGSRGQGSASKGAGKGGSFGGSRRRTNRRRSRRRCDIFLKYNISPLTDMNLIRDDLAEVAYFVKEIQK